MYHVQAIPGMIHVVHIGQECSLLSIEAVYFLCLIRLGTYGLLIVCVCTLFRSSYSWIRWKDDAPTKLTQKQK